MEEFKWRKIYDKVASEADEVRKKMREGKLISQKEAALVREKQLYDEMNETREKEKKNTVHDPNVSQEPMGSEAYSLEDEPGEKKQDDSKKKQPDGGKTAPAPADQPQTAGEEEDPVRAAAWHTIRKLEDSPDLTYADLLDPAKTKTSKDAKGNLNIETTTTKEESDKIFLELTKKLWDELTVHGKIEFNFQKKEKSLKNVSDLDGKSCLMFMKMAGINTDQVKYVYPGETAESGIVMDTSNEHGTIATESGRKLTIDHHSKESDRSTSATKFVYEMLVGMGLLKKENYLDKYVSFVTDCDNAAFTENEAKKIYANYSKNPYGMEKRLAPEQILEFIKDGGDPIRGFSKDYLKNHTYFNPSSKNSDKMDTLEQLSGHIFSKMKETENKIKQMENQGFVIDTGKGRFGKILIDTKKPKNAEGKIYPKIPIETGHLGVRAAGYGGYLIWSPEEDSFVVYTTRPMNEETLPGGFPDGFNIRGNMWMKPPHDLEPLSLNLEQMLAKLTGKDDFKIEGKLKESLEKEEEARAKAEAKLQQAGSETDEKQEKISNSVKNLAVLFSNFELSHDAIRAEAGRINVETVDLAIALIESNDELNSQFKAQLSSIDKKDKKAFEKLAVVVILENQESRIIKKTEELEKTIIAKEADLKIESDSKKQNELKKDIKNIEDEKDKLEDKLSDLAKIIIPLKKA